MNDPEVARLRRLRLAALWVRALANAHGATRTAAEEPLFSRMACATWRIARAASGRLRAHPYSRYQKDPSVMILGAYGALAWLLAVFGRNRVRALGRCTAPLGQLARQLDDARALTWTPDLSDTLGRSQVELRTLMQALAFETRSGSDVERLPTRGSPATEGRHGEVPAFEGDWPYLAF